jgi:hypothetical protein
VFAIGRHRLGYPALIPPVAPRAGPIKASEVGQLRRPKRDGDVRTGAPIGHEHTRPPCRLNVRTETSDRRSTLDIAAITMAAMAALGVRSGSLRFGRGSRSRCKRQVSANAGERARTLANPCHAEGRGFESHHPLLKLPVNRGLFRIRGTWVRDESQRLDSKPRRARRLHHSADRAARPAKDTH